jgi:hypothetical protein
VNGRCHAAGRSFLHGFVALLIAATPIAAARDGEENEHQRDREVVLHRPLSS